MKQIGNIGKFSFSEMTSNSNGKTSSTAVAGLYITAIGGLCFLAGSIGVLFFESTVDVLEQSTILASVGAALLGVKNIVRFRKGSEVTEPNDVVEETQEKTKSDETPEKVPSN